MDVRIGEMHLMGRIAGSPRVVRSSASVLEALANDTARKRMLDALECSFDGEEVIVIRSLHCRGAARIGGVSPAGEALTRLLARSAVQTTQDHPTNDDHVVRFPSQAVFIAGFIGDALDGRWDLWYYSAFQKYRRGNGAFDWDRLVSAHRDLRWQIIQELERQGDLELFMNAIGEAGLRELVGDRLQIDVRSWEPIVATANQIVGELGGRLASSANAGSALASELANERPIPDWRDETSLGQSVAIAAGKILGHAGSDTNDAVRGSELDAIIASATNTAWMDQAAFATTLSDIGHAGDHRGSRSFDEKIGSPRTRQILTSLLDCFNDPRLQLDPAQPTCSANLVRVLAMLADRAPQWRDDDLAHSLAAHALRRWALSDATAAPTAQASTTVLTEIVALLGQRFSAHPVERSALGAHSDIASALLLLRSVHDLGLTGDALSLVGVTREALLSSLLRRWAGRDAEVRGVDPVLNWLDHLAAQGVDGSQVAPALICERTARRLLGQRIVKEPCRLVTVPFGATRFATLALGSCGRVLPLGSIAGADAIEGVVTDLVELGHDNEPVKLHVLSEVAALVATFDNVRVADADLQTELDLDLLAIACVQAWARWLPGFAQASVPFLLENLVRRPARVRVDQDTLDVHVPTRPHDIVLELAGYLQPFQAGPELGERQIRFVLGDDRGR